MRNPYSGKPDHQFWRRAMAGRTAEEVDPVVAAPWRIAPTDRIVTAGSCFAQHIARTLAASGYNYLVTEAAPAHAFSGTEQYGLFTARYGNVYTVRQLLQLFDRAYAVFEPAALAWTREDGRLVDPFRPTVAAFADRDELVAERDAHLEAVRAAFELADVLVFTLGLTEAWVARKDGAVFPLAPGVIANPRKLAGVRFANFSVAEMSADLAAFVGKLRTVNPRMRVILTVSPVPLAATFEDAHVLAATTYSKAALRVVAEEAVRTLPDVAYFPSYEIVTGPQARGRFWADDLREVTPEGVATVMRVFARHYLGGEAAAPRAVAALAPSAAAMAEQATLAAVICDEELIEGAAG